MPVVLARIDDRLIHGQVTAGWAPQLQPTRIILANNAIATDSWQSRVYASSVPPGIEVSILSIAGAASLLASRESAGERSILLTGSAGEMAELVRLGAPLVCINLGGVHFSPGKVEMLPWVYLDSQDLVALRRLLEMGVELSAQQVPGGREVSIDSGNLLELEEKF
ncbi:MAG: PTS sugar transporter subunit IIB [Gemmatimonadales bacterium]|nr:PTS sugar transporter subunit IIB [Gemmatimonadales bacterium]